jgi:hypothetical protein
VVIACAAKAAETIVVAIARTKKAFAQYLPKEEYTEEQGELWDVGVIGSLNGSLLRPETLVPTVTFPGKENLLHESCTDWIYQLAIVSLFAGEHRRGRRLR